MKIYISGDRSNASYNFNKRNTKETIRKYIETEFVDSLDQADTIYMLPEYHESEDSIKELKEAEDKGLKVIYGDEAEKVIDKAESTKQTLWRIKMGDHWNLETYKIVDELEEDLEKQKEDVKKFFQEVENV